MSEGQPVVCQAQRKHACSLCSRRKVKCDRSHPCSNCTRSNTQCTYNASVAPQSRKRAADEDLIARLSQYEELMRKHNVDFTPYAHTWVSSVYEPKVKENLAESPSSPPPAHAPNRPTKQVTDSTGTQGDQCLWTSLSSELKYPPVQRFRRDDDPVLLPELPLHELVSSNQPTLKHLHPQPRQIYTLWQIFVDKVNPLLKIVHIPSLGQRVLDASWDPGSAPKPLAAIMFAVYGLAVASTASGECHTSFHESKETLLTRFRMASFRALMEAEFLTTRDFEVLQALTLFLFTGPESELTSTLAGAAIRIGQRMGLHHDKADLKLSVFENELRTRLWWQLNGLDSRVRSCKSQGTKLTPSQSNFGNIRLPLNVNDADLHPDMVEIPREYNGPTEMSAVLLKFEIYNWYRSSSTAVKLMEAVAQGPQNDGAMELADTAIQELEMIYEEKYLKCLDHSIPLHRLTNAMARLSIARLRFKVHHPRRSAVSACEVQMSQQDNDILFGSAVTWLRMINVGIQSNFSPHIIFHFTAMHTVDAYIYIISELRRRTFGQQVNLAWELVEDLYTNYSQLTGDKENKFFTALGELTLEAWNSRKEALMLNHGIQAADMVPASIQLLQNALQVGKMQSTEIVDEGPLDIDFSGDVDINWEYWNDFLR